MNISVCAYYRFWICVLLYCVTPNQQVSYIRTETRFIYDVTKIGRARRRWGGGEILLLNKKTKKKVRNNKNKEDHYDN